jgi:hypothetical protein
MTDDPEPQLQPRSPIPDFAGIEEEAAFWDTHDFTDYLDETWPVNVRVSEEFRARVLGKDHSLPLASDASQ